MKIEGSREIRMDYDLLETSEGDTREKKDGPLGEMKKERRQRIRVKGVRGRRVKTLEGDKETGRGRENGKEEGRGSKGEREQLNIFHPPTF